MIPLAAILDLHERLRHVRYKLGAKAKASIAPEKIEELDCSGYLRYVLQRCGRPEWPDGTWGQRKYLILAGWHKLKQYRDVRYARKDPNRLFVAVFLEGQDSLGRRRYGHIWFVYMGQTMECSSRRGVNSRPWNTAALLKNGPECWEIPVRVNGQ